MDNTYTLGDLVKITGAKPRSLQLWADRKVIRAIKNTDDSGSGVHRRFSRDETIIACIIQAFALRHMSIGQLKAIADGLRNELGPEGWDMLRDAAGGKENRYIDDTFVIYFTRFVPNKKGVLEEDYSIGIVDELAINAESFAHNLKEPSAMIMTIRLETYLSKLK